MNVDGWPSLDPEAILCENYPMEPEETDGTTRPFSKDDTISGKDALFLSAVMAEYAQKNAGKRCRAFLGPNTLSIILDRAIAKLQAMPNTVVVKTQHRKEKVAIVGDILGQYFDLQNAYSMAWEEGCSTIIFTGNYIGDGSWSVECITLLATLLVADPCPAMPRIVLLRGCQECTFAMQCGFVDEVHTKYGHAILAKFVKFFTALPIAAVVTCGVGKDVLVVHSGLWRSNPSSYDTSIGTMSQLDLVDRLHMPNLFAPAFDPCWTDPCYRPISGAFLTTGSIAHYGPNISEVFLTAHNFQMMVRSHQGPENRGEGNLDHGFCFEHYWKGTDIPSVVTIFSAPDAYFGKKGRPKTTGAFMILQHNYERIGPLTWLFEIYELQKAPEPARTRY